MPEPLLLAVAQPFCTPYDVAANATRHAEVVRAADASVVVFPELSLTGYELDAPALDPNDDRLAPLTQACAETGALALAGAPVRDLDGREYIAILAVTGDGAAVAYRKMFLHPPEDQRFAAGERPAVIEVDGWRLGLAICKDTGVAEHAAATAEVGMDAYVAGVLFSVRGGERREERVRAIAGRHGVWVALACFAGSTGDYPQTSGGSGIWNPSADTIVQAGAEPGQWVTAKLE